MAKKFPEGKGKYPLLSQKRGVQELFDTAYDIKVRVTFPFAVVNGSSIKNDIIKSEKMLKKLGV